MLADKLSRLAMVLSMALVLLAPQMSFGQTIEERPTPMAMTADLLIARPLLLMATAIGSAMYLVSLPFSLAAGNAAEVGESFVVGPAMSTFARCLGCKRSGYKKKVVNAGEEG